MENKKAIFLASVMMLSVVAIGVIVVNGKEETPTAFAYSQTNEYGCTGNCTGEYHPSHIKKILENDPSKNGSHNIRIKCEYVNDVYFKDVGAQLTYRAGDDQEAMAIDVGFTWWNDVGIDYRSSIKQGDVVCMFGTVNYTLYGVKRVVVTDPIIYAVNETVNTSLLPDVNYIG